MAFEDDDNTIYEVVINHEEQYSIWPDGREVPMGWRKVWGPAAKQDCLDHIEQDWTDPRPRTLREKMEDEDAARDR